MEEYLTCPGEVHNVSINDTSESQRLVLQPSMAIKTAVFKRHKKPVTSAISSSRKDVPRSGSLIFIAEPRSINMLQSETGEETKTTVHMQKKEQLRCKMVISKEKWYVQL
jgi:hypothetical protein